MQIWTKSVAGDSEAPSLESRWMWRYPVRKAARSQKLEPRPLIPSSHPPPTLLQAVERQCELAHKIIGGGGVIVLDHKPHQHQLWDPKLELQSLLPAGVEA